MYREIPCESEDAWHETRRQGVGASESAALFGASPYLSRYALWARKISPWVASKRGPDSEPAKWGRRLEAPISDAYAAETGRPITDLGRHTVLASVDNPRMLATLDRITEGSNGPEVLEVKTAGDMQRAKWADGPPLHYVIQVQHQLAVTGFRRGVIAVLLGGQDFQIHPIERNEPFIDHLKTNVATFWATVDSKVSPPVDDSEVTHDAVRKLYKEDGHECVLSDEYDEIDRELSEIKADAKVLDVRRRGLESKLISAIGSASVARLSSGGIYTYKTTERSAYSVAASTSRVLRRKI